MVRKSLSFIKIEPESEDDTQQEGNNAKRPTGSDNDDRGSESGDELQPMSRQSLGTLCKQLSIASDVEQRLYEYLKERPMLQPLSPSRSGVDIDLTDPDEETWIIQCPASVDLDQELLKKKLDLSAPHSTIKNCSVPLEATVRRNDSEQMIGILSGSRVKSFVPAGFVRIKEALPAVTEPDLSSHAGSNHVAVPYPEDIRERHPLLGFDYKEFLAMPKAVKKQLSFARQKADLMYSGRLETKPVSVKVDPESRPVSSAASRKRKDASLTVAETAVTVKEEPSSPKAKKKKDKPSDDPKAVSIKKERTVEDDDISWLLSI